MSDDTKFVIYLGDNMSAAIPGEMKPFVRGLPRAFSCANGKAKILKSLYPKFQIFNERQWYIGPMITLDSFEDFKRELKAGDKILIMRDMGLGDIILAMPTLKLLRELLPGVHVSFATLPQFHELFQGHDFIDELIDISSGIDLQRGEYKLVINWCRGLEHYNIQRNRGPRVESYAKHLGLKYESLPPVPLNISADNELAADSILNGIRGPYIGYVLKAAAWHRTYPIWRVREIFEEIGRAFPDHTILIVDNQKDFGLFQGIKNVRNIAGRTRTIMDAAAVMKRCDAVITPDTGLAHVAGSLGIKTLVLLSSMPFSWRYAHYGPCIIGINKTTAGECVPCWDWQRGHGRITYCDRTNDNICLSKLPATEVIEKLKSLIGEFAKCSA